MKSARSVVVAGLVGAALVAGALPAYAIKEINPVSCELDVSAKYFHLGIHNSNGTGTTRCWADAGDTSIGQPGVVGFSSGNNAGYFEYEPGDGGIYRHTFGKNESITKNYGLVTVLHIN
jgi:hypothetical protein